VIERNTNIIKIQNSLLKWLLPLEYHMRKEKLNNPIQNIIMIIWLFQMAFVTGNTFKINLYLLFKGLIVFLSMGIRVLC